MNDRACCLIHVDFCARRTRRTVLVVGIAFACIAVFYLVFALARDTSQLLWFDRAAMAGGVVVFGGLSAGFLALYFRGASSTSVLDVNDRRGTGESQAACAIRECWGWAGAPPGIARIRPIIEAAPESRQQVTVVLLGPPVGEWGPAEPGPVSYSTDRGNPLYVALALFGLALAVGAYALARWLYRLDSLFVAGLVVLIPLVIPGSFWVRKLLLSPAQLRVKRYAAEVWRYRWGRVCTYRSIPIQAGTLVVITRTPSVRSVSLASGETVEVVRLDEVHMDDPLWSELLGKLLPDAQCGEFRGRCGI